VCGAFAWFLKLDAWLDGCVSSLGLESVMSLPPLNLALSPPLKVLPPLTKFV